MHDSHQPDPSMTVTRDAVAPMEGGSRAVSGADEEHVEGILAGAGGAEIFWQAWLPLGAPRAVVLIAHSVGEHSGRYGHVAGRLTAAGFATYALDHRGHGRSSGPRALIDRMDHAVTDVDSLVTLAASGQASRPVYLLGHSMGGAIALAYALRYQERLRGLLLSSAAASTETASPAARREAKVLAAATPTVGIIEIDAGLLSRDHAVVRAYRDDPLVHHGKLPAGTVSECARTIAGFAAELPMLRLPLLVMAGTGDRIVPPAGSRMVHDRAGSPDRTLRTYDGLYHELFNEPERRVVLGDVVFWLEARTVPQHLPAQAQRA